MVVSVSFRCVTHHPGKAWTVRISTGRESIEGACSAGLGDERIEWALPEETWSTGDRPAE